MELNIILAPILLLIMVFVGLPAIVSHPQEYLHIPALAIVLGGSLFSVVFGAKFNNLKSFFHCLVFIVVPQKKMAPKEAIELIVHLSTVSLVNGKPALATELEKISDPFLSYGIQLVIDRFQDPFIRAALYNSIQEMQERHRTVYTLYKNASVVAPVAGMVGTVIGLIQVLSSMQDTTSLGKAMALGLIATFYGGFFSSMVFNPIAQKLRILSEEEAQLKKMMAEGIIYIAKGEVPLKIEKYLLSYLNFSKIEITENKAEKSKAPKKA